MEPEPIDTPQPANPVTESAQEFDDSDFETLSKQELQGMDAESNYVTMDAPQNSVYDAERNRTIGMPQTLNAAETKFVMQRDVDQVKNFFGMEDVGAFDAFGKGIDYIFIGQLPQAYGNLMLEKGERQREQDLAKLEMATAGEAPQYAKTYDKYVTKPINSIVSFFGGQPAELLTEKIEKDKPWNSQANKEFIKQVNISLSRNDELIGKSEDLIERNKKYMADAGFERPEQGGVAGVMWDIGNGAGSLLTALGMTAATRSVVPATLLFGSLKKSQIYEEARTAGKSPDSAGKLSDIAGVIEGALEAVGIDRFVKVLKGNTAVKRFLEGAVVEGTQEASQQAAEEGLTAASGVRKESLGSAAQSILYSGFLGAVLGGGTSAAVGTFVKTEAKKQNMTDEEADNLSKYAEQNVDAAKQNMGEFIDKELAPIAADEKSAMEFMQIMKNFDNDASIVNRDSLDAESRKVFDQYVEIFNSSQRDKTGVKAVSETFYNQAKKAGVKEDEAAAAAQLVGARADAASRALGITPQQWYESKKLMIKGALQTRAKKVTSNKVAKQEVSPERDNLYKALDSIRSGKPISKVRKGSKQPILSYLKKRGGIRIGSTADQNLRSMGITPKTNVGLFRKNGGIGELDNIDTYSLQSAIGSEVQIPTENANASEAWLYERISDETFGKSLDQVVNDEQSGVDQLERQLEAYGIDTAKMSNEEIADMLDGIREKEATELMLDDEILFQDNARGSIKFDKDSTIISLFKAANPSTLLHELGHLFLRDMQAVANASIRPAVKADYENIKKWLGAKDENFTVEQEEKFARGFEAYLREGKAPQSELQGIFDKFKEWLSAIYKNIRDLNVDINDDIRRVFDRMLGGDFAKSETLLQEADARDIAADYKAVATGEDEATFWRDTAAVFHNISDLSADAFVPVSTRLGNIDKKLKHVVRQFVFKTGLYTHEDRQKIKPFIETVSNKMTPEDYRIFNLALKNRDKPKVDFMVGQYKLERSWSAVRDVLDNLYNQAKDVGLGLNYVQDYFPRKVRNNKVAEYMAAIRGLDEWSEIEAALKAADPEAEFTTEEKAAFVNNYLRGFTTKAINLSKPSFLKERSIDYVTPQFNQYYEDSMQALMEYVGALRHGIESRKLFGKSETDTENNIGKYVLSLVRDGVIKQAQEEELKKLLKAVVEPTGTRGAVAWAKNANYIYLMGNPISAITQIQDLAFSLWKNGYYGTIKSFAKSLTRQQILKKEDLGIDNILQEFEGEGRAASAVRKVFKAVGLEAMDNVGKEVYIDASYSRLRKLNRKGNKAFAQQLKTIFGTEAAQVSKDLSGGTLSENVKYLLFSELSDVQPISLAEMPRGYLRGGNGRIFYMLKSYTVRQIDIYRREVYSEIRSGDPKRVAAGLSNLSRLAASLMLMGVASDALKDLLLGREIEVGDLVTDNILKIVGFTKYQVYKARDEGIANTFWKTLFVPPIATPIDDLGKDIKNIGFKDKPAKDSELLGRVPVVGKFYYWWWGGGRAKGEKEKKKKSTVSTP